MKFLVKMRIPTQIGNKRLKEDKLIKDLDRFIAAAKPLSVYYGISEGKRAQFMVIDIESAEKIPQIFEPFWLTAEAEISLTPVMDADEFKKAGAGIEKVLKSI